jgi:hypothetical protein
MTSTSDLGKYFESIAASIALETNPDDDDPAPVAVRFGRREVYRQDNFGPNGRIVIAYGAPEGDAGTEAACRYPGGDPIPLVDTLDTFTVYVWGCDPTDTSEDHSELAQYDATDALFRLWRALTYGTDTYKGWNDFVRIQSRAWVNPKNIERQYGKEMQIVCQFRSPVLDTPYELHKLKSSLDIESVGVTEHVNVTTE